MPNLGTTEIIIIAVVVLILFGTKKLPDASRALGRSMRIFKSETKGLRDDDKDDKESKDTKDHEDEGRASSDESKEPQSLTASTSSEETVVNGKVVNRDETHQPH